MKRLSLTGVIIAITIVVLSQALQAFNYQAILRNSDGTVKAYAALNSISGRHIIIMLRSP